jgi:hypothetical protein
MLAAGAIAPPVALAAADALDTVSGALLGSIGVERAGGTTGGARCAVGHTMTGFTPPHPSASSPSPLEDRVISVTCPRCQSPGARKWHARIACGCCGMLWVPYAEPPLSPKERYHVRRAMDEMTIRDRGGQAHDAAALAKALGQVESVDLALIVYADCQCELVTSVQQDQLPDALARILTAFAEPDRTAAVGQAVDTDDSPPPSSGISENVSTIIGRHWACRSSSWIGKQTWCSGRSPSWNGASSIRPSARLSL